MFYLYAIGYDDDSSEHKMSQPSKQKQGKVEKRKEKRKVIEAGILSAEDSLSQSKRKKCSRKKKVSVEKI